MHNSKRSVAVALQLVCPAIDRPKEMIHYGFTKAGELAVARSLAQLTPELP
jgi:hypothetical protein